MAAATTVNDYRPISCCTVFYKIISKMLVNKLRQVHLLHGSWSVFRQLLTLLLSMDISTVTLKGNEDFDKRMSRDHEFGFHPKCRNLGITHLAYADDLLLLSGGDVSSVSMIMSCLNNFEDMAGLRINFLKSNVYMASVSDVVRQEIIDVIGFTPGPLPFQYLGVPLAGRGLTTSYYSAFVDGIECFWLSILPLPVGIIDSIYSLCRKFVWPTKHPPIAWAVLCKPIEAGGWGLKNLKAWNKSFLAKTLGNIHKKKEYLWIKWVNHLYSHVPNVRSWDWNKEQSPLIKQLIKIRDEMISLHGSVQASVSVLDSWFGGNSGLSNAYDFFVCRWNRWPWKPLLAKNCILPKHRFTLWLVAQRKLLTRDRLGYLDDRTCVLCHDEYESVNHLFFQCPISRAIWDAIRSWLRMLKLMGSPNVVLAAFRSAYRGNSAFNKMRCVALAATVYQIWNIRKRRIFDNDEAYIEGVKMKIKIHVLRSVSNAIDVI
ncbi:uncharacterized protein LOC142520163 [Primulina tabacum]|uniref:uncharacterized protein LOC142520163 n=1 Tax=Primulina tabacum TaxID=48773 RepID=UPI003F597BAC